MLSRFLKGSLALLFAMILLHVPSVVKAVSCVQRSPMIGLVGEIQKGEQYSEIALIKPSLFKPSIGEESGVTIDDYLKLVKKYIKNGHNLFTDKDPSAMKTSKTVTLYNASLEKISFEKGDIIVNGPPGNSCDFSFTGIFTKDGNIRYAEIEGLEYNYSYGDTKFGAKFGKKIKCDKVYCISEADFTFGEESFSLKSGESRVLKNGPVADVFLINVLERKTSDSSPVKDRITYVVSFLRK